MYNTKPKRETHYYEEKSEGSSFNPELNYSIDAQFKEKPIELITDKKLNASKRHFSYIADFWDVLSFGICVAMGNIFIAWGTGFSNGYWDFFFATAISCSCFICLFLSIAEIISIVPFGGGTYALARVTVGPYLGFLVGCCESIGNIIFGFVAMMPLGTTITYMFNGDPMYEPIYWLVIYLLVIGTEFAGRKVYFTFLRCVAFISLAIITLYVIISIQELKIEKYIPSLADNTYRGGITDLLPLLYPSGWWYFGVEIMPLMSDEVRNAKVTSPKAIVWTTAIVTVLAFICMLISYCQYPSYQDDYALALHSLPLSSGFTNAFGISDQMATILSYPGLYISNALFIYGYGKQLSALAKSKLLPSCFGWTLTGSSIPYFALLFGSLVGYLILVVLTKGYGYNYDSELTNELFNAALMGSYFTFEIMFVSFIVFRYKYAKLARSYTSPLGVPGAIFGILGFGFLFASAIGYSEDDYHAFYFFLVFLALASIYYFVYAKHTQVFSEDEQSVMFVVYLLKENERKLKARKMLQKYIQSKTAITVPVTAPTLGHKSPAAIHPSNPPPTTQVGLSRIDLTSKEKEGNNAELTPEDSPVPHDTLVKKKSVKFILPDSNSMD